MAKKKETQSTDILAKYTEHCLEHESFPKSVYKFCKTHKIEEADFYAHYSSLDALKHGVWSAFFDNAQTLMQKNSSISELNRKDRLLTFYYTFFEVLLLNRSYVLFALSNDVEPLKKMGQLKQLRTAVKAYAEELIEEGNEDKSRFSRNAVPLFAEATWVQLLFVLKFWIEDDSPTFEKTDALIEKSVRAAFEVFDNTSIDTLVDLGKFLWKEVAKQA